jgi:hypothetical protein
VSYADPEKAKAYRREWERKNRTKRNLQFTAWRERNPDKLKKYDKDYYAANRDRILSKNRSWENAHRAERNEYARTKYRENAPLRRLQAASRKYGIALNDLAALRDAQFNRCEICSVEFDTRTSPCVDHDHDTGKVRGLLCKHCNFAIGHLHNSPRNAMSAAVYLRATTSGLALSA